MAIEAYIERLEQIQKGLSALKNDAAKSDFGQYLGGGGTQLLVDFEHSTNKHLREKVLGFDV